MSASSTVLDLSGTLDMAVEYGPFGELVSGSMVGAYGFSTKWQDPVTGMHDYGLRWYSAGLGRWLNRDPIEELGGLNLYGFVRNDGVNRWDYLGMNNQVHETQPGRPIPPDASVAPPPRPGAPGSATEAGGNVIDMAATIVSNNGRGFTINIGRWKCSKQLEEQLKKDPCKDKECAKDNMFNICERCCVITVYSIPAQPPNLGSRRIWGLHRASVWHRSCEKARAVHEEALRGPTIRPDYGTNSTLETLFYDM